MPRLAFLALGLALPLRAGAGDWLVVTDEPPGALARAHGATFEYHRVLTGFAFRGPDQVAAELALHPHVRAVVPDTELHLDDVAGWGVFRVRADEAHREVNGRFRGAGVRIAVVDSGVDLDHPDLAGHLLEGTNCIDPSAPPDDDNGHGTHVAGIAAAVYGPDGFGVVGVAPEASVLPIKAFDASGSATTSQVLCGLEAVAARLGDGVPTVVNMSFGETGVTSTCDDGDVSDVLHEAICDLADAGAVLVAGSGNDAGAASTFLPGAFDEVITVSAWSDFDGAPGGTGGCSFSWEYGYECDDTLADFSNTGPEVDLTAPGVFIYSTLPGGGHDTKSGTSMAAPHVSGVAALVLEADPLLDTAGVEALLRATGACPAGRDASGCLGAWPDDPDGVAEPLVDALAAVEAAAAGSPPSEEEPPPEPTSITLAVELVKSRGDSAALLSWNPSGAAAIEVWRDDLLLETGPDDGEATDHPTWKGRREVTWQVCEAGTSRCSNVVADKL